MNIVKAMMMSYVDSDEWIKKHNEDREEFIWTLTNSKGISYEEKAQGHTHSMDMRGAINADKTKEWDTLYAFEVRHYENVLMLCKFYLRQVNPKNRKVVDYWMTTRATIKWIAVKCNYSESRVKQIINEETTRISNERLAIGSGF